MLRCVCLCLSINDQPKSNESTDSIRSPFLTCWPSLGLGLAPHLSLSLFLSLSLHHYADQSQRGTVDCLFRAHPQSPPQALLPSNRHSSPSVSLPSHPTVSQTPFNALNKAELSHPTQKTGQFPFPK